MIIHARFLIKTCHHASHFYALNKHNYLCICLEIFLGKCKPLARVDPIINRPLTNWCESPCKKKAFRCGYNKDKMSRRVKWHGQNVEYCSFFLSVCILLLKWTISSFNKTEVFPTLSVMCLWLNSHLSVGSYRVRVSFAPLYISVLNDTERLICCMRSTVLQHIAASLFFPYNTCLPQESCFCVQTLNSLFSFYPLV